MYVVISLLRLTYHLIMSLRTKVLDIWHLKVQNQDSDCGGCFGAKSTLPPDDFVVGLVVMLVGGPVTVAVVDTDVARVGVSLQRSSWQQ